MSKRFREYVGRGVATTATYEARALGVHSGSWLADVARGRDERPVVTVREPKSLSRQTTFERDPDPLRDREILSRMLLSLCERVSKDLKREGYAGKTIGVK